ncbi:MAG: hypothetical protein Q9227_003626 [Pyrenula ochraceoflavens]
MSLFTLNPQNDLSFSSLPSWRFSETIDSFQRSITIPHLFDSLAVSGNRHKPSTVSLPKHGSNLYDQENRTHPICPDWIFTSASNVHIAVDKASFKQGTYTPLRSHVLTIAEQKPVTVKGIGTVELILRRKSQRRSDADTAHMVILEDVLHVPGWVCNIFSDVYFLQEDTIGRFDHKWTSEGAVFREKKGFGRPGSQGRSSVMEVQEWGYTEDFFGLERLAVVEQPSDSGVRSVMEEQYAGEGREIWSVNLWWPAGQRERWEEFKMRRVILD